MKGLDKDIGPWATPEDRQVLVKASRLLGQGRGLIVVDK